MVSRLFKIYKPHIDNKSKKKINAFKQSDFMKPRFLFNPKEYCKDMMPFCLSCRCTRKYCAPDRLERAFSKARDQMREEINIIEIIKSRRYQKAALKILLSKQQRHTLKEQCRYLAIDPDSYENLEKEQKEKVDNTVNQDEWTDGFYYSSSSENEILDFEKNDA